MPSRLDFHVGQQVELDTAEAASVRGTVAVIGGVLIAVDTAAGTLWRRPDQLRRHPDWPPAVVPDHPHVPACDVGACNVCSTCRRVHHGSGAWCVGCWPASESSS